MLFRGLSPLLTPKNRVRVSPTRSHQHIYAVLWRSSRLSSSRELLESFRWRLSGLVGIWPSVLGSGYIRGGLLSLFHNPGSVWLIPVWLKLSSAVSGYIPVNFFAFPHCCILLLIQITELCCHTFLYILVIFFSRPCWFCSKILASFSLCVLRKYNL